MPYGVIHYNTPADDFEEFIKWASETGFECCEVMLRDVWPDESEYQEDGAHKAKEILDEHGMFASALQAGNDFVQLDDEAVQEQAERMEKVARLAKILGTDVLRTEGGRPKDEVPMHRWSEAMAKCLKACVPFCEDMGVKLAVDNHGVVSNNPVVILEALHAVDHELIGSNLDTMNLRWWGNPVSELPTIYRALAPFVHHVHMKDGFNARPDYQGQDLGNGEIPLKECVDILVEAGYNGPWIAEWEGQGDKGEGYANCLKWLKANCPG
ncbi:MAG: sugar phosphate isomerase/epimerase family protein [Armatimonadota bacterium]